MGSRMTAVRVSPYEEVGAALVKEAQRIEREQATAMAALSSLSIEQLDALVNARLLGREWRDAFMCAYASRMAA
jgi:hypothetical protein